MWQHLGEGSPKFGADSHVTLHLTGRRPSRSAGKEGLAAGCAGSDSSSPDLWRPAPSGDPRNTRASVDIRVAQDVVGEKVVESLHQFVAEVAFPEIFSGWSIARTPRARSSIGRADHASVQAATDRMPASIGVSRRAR